MHLTLKIPTAKTDTSSSSSRPQDATPRKDSTQPPATSSSSKPRQASAHVSPLDTSTTPPPRRTPSPPPYSPITPKTIAAQLATYQPYSREELASQLPPVTVIERPKPVPINESENTDAVALRAAIALLQVQRERCRRDIRDLDRVRGEALRDPGGFVDVLRERGEKRKKQRRMRDVLGPTLRGFRPDDAGESKDEEREVKDTQSDGSEVRPPSSESSESDSESEDSGKKAEERFPPLPEPQNIFRCPPINWTKYHISGEPLDRMHEEHRARPMLGEPEVNGSGRPAPYVLAAPYSPFRDVGGIGGEHPMQTRKGSKKQG